MRIIYVLYVLYSYIVEERNSFSCYATGRNIDREEAKDPYTLLILSIVYITLSRFGALLVSDAGAARPIQPLLACSLSHIRIVYTYYHESCELRASDAVLIRP